MAEQNTFDIIVVGAGHAGCEAAASAANLGAEVLLITMNMMTIAQMSCNPSIGGIAKGQIVREIDALGGYTGIIADRTMIQFKMLNKSKGPAMWSPRTQNDRFRFSDEWRSTLEANQNVHFWQDVVEEIVVQDEKVAGVVTKLGKKFQARAVVLSNGTFLNGLIHIGDHSFGGGRIGESASVGLTANLINLGFEARRMKTGTPPRIDGRSIDFSKMEEQPGDPNPGRFSFTPTEAILKQKSCFLTYTNEKVHEILKTGFDRSPLFTGRIKGRGPRYCPSIEDKIERFASRERHQLFIEPEGADTVEYYVNGFSSSLPLEVQYEALKNVSGLENVRMFRPGYAIEYDYFPPYQIKNNLETKKIKNLFFAGQINGTTGYEEAAAQGLMAGINAYLAVEGKDPFVLSRTQAYIGVLIDDLITKGTDEPYRMFTSRAEYRLLLRQDNADQRLTPLAYALGLASEERMNVVKKKSGNVKMLIQFLKETATEPAQVNPILENQKTNPISGKTKLGALILRPQVSISDLIPGHSELHDFLQTNHYTDEELEEAEICIKYETYIAKEREMAEKLSEVEEYPLRIDFDYNSLTSLSSEAREKLTKIKPETIGQAARISGVSPSDISVLIMYLAK